MNWRDHAMPEELERIEELKMQRHDATGEIKQIYERCRKRCERAKAKADKENNGG